MNSEETGPDAAPESRAPWRRMLVPGVLLLGGAILAWVVVGRN